MTLESNTDSDKEVAELWELAGQLSNALAKNRENMESLVNDIEELKQQASQYNFPLIRTDYKLPPLTDTSTPLDVENVQLACENQKLISENANLTETVEEYETTIRLVVSKFRTQAIKIQQAKKQLNYRFEEKMAEERLRTQALQYENNDLRSRLAETAKLIQKTYNSQLEIDSSTIISSLTEENQQMQEVLGIADGVCIDGGEEYAMKRDNAVGRTLGKRHESLGGVEDVVEARERDVPGRVFAWEGGVKVDGEFLEKDGLK
ncbi:8584_t:CDS:2 [Paraglomus brasilianum]|uniref:8584_t:CDS:1 n=1 Tax=Paraglomus brasilianum TaxID=144538 RepID=A0A9N9CIC3_9GLOM|nr:8584_t:CDS:2 [Paraglomus brasilianum]